jgi:chitinase
MARLPHSEPVTVNNIKSTLCLRRGWMMAGLCAAAAFAASARAADPAPAWQVDVYYPIGTVVSYQGHPYQALVSQVDFRDSGWNPAVTKLWKDLGTQGRFNLRVSWFTHISFSNTEARCALAWNSATIYTTGGVASVDGVDYKANWWTQGESPATHSSDGIGQPWTRVGSCAEASRTAAQSKAAAESQGAQPLPDSKTTVQAQAEEPKG